MSFLPCATSGFILAHFLSFADKYAGQSKQTYKNSQAEPWSTKGTKSSWPAPTLPTLWQQTVVLSAAVPHRAIHPNTKACKVWDFFFPPYTLKACNSFEK